MHFDSGSVAYKLRHGEFDHLSERDRRRLVRLMARIAEKSYRRGVIHGALPDSLPLASRFIRASLTTAPWSILQGQPRRLAKRGGIVLASGSKGALGERHGSFAGENSAVVTA